MRLFLSLIAAAFLFGSVAEAGSNIKQKGSGATVWQDNNGNEVPVGDSGLTVTLDAVSTAGTTYVVSHKAGKIVKIYAVEQGTYTAQSDVFALTFAIGSDGQFAPISAGATLTMSATSGGTVDSISPSDSAVDVSAGEAIAIISDGGSTGAAVQGVVTIVIE